MRPTVAIQNAEHLTSAVINFAVKKPPIFATSAPVIFQSIKKVGVIKINNLAIFTGKT
jgi:hypothetical protein